MPHARVPVHVVAGTAGRNELIGRLCAARPSWVGLLGAPLHGASANLRVLSGGCPCCTGKVILQVSLARALRETRATRAFVAVSDASHAATLERVLAEPPLSFAVTSARRILLPLDSTLKPADLEIEAPAE